MNDLFSYLAGGILLLILLSAYLLIAGGLYAIFWQLSKRWIKLPWFNAFSYGIMSALTLPLLAVMTRAVTPKEVFHGTGEFVIVLMILLLPFLITRPLLHILPPGLKKLKFW